jgi:hypothetical protein
MTRIFYLILRAWRCPKSTKGTSALTQRTIALAVPLSHLRCTCTPSPGRRCRSPGASIRRASASAAATPRHRAQHQGVDDGIDSASSTGNSSAVSSTATTARRRPRRQIRSPPQPRLRLHCHDPLHRLRVVRGTWSRCRRRPLARCCEQLRMVLGQLGVHRARHPRVHPREHGRAFRKRPQIAEWPP